MSMTGATKRTNATVTYEIRCNVCDVIICYLTTKYYVKADFTCRQCYARIISK